MTPAGTRGASGEIARVADALGRRARGQMAGFAGRRGKAAILMYHRIAAPADDPWDICVSELTFARQLEMLRAEYRVLPLAELAAAVAARRLPERAIAITFDDGYADNLHRAAPLLERNGLTATLYLTTSFQERPREFWWDLLLDALIGPGERPPRLAVAVGGTSIDAPTTTPAERRHLALDVLQPALRACGVAAIEATTARICEWAGLDATAAPTGSAEDPLRRPLSPEEAAQLAAGAAFELGAHTATHPSLRALGDEEARAEVLASRELVADLAGRSPRSFAYPFGENLPADRRLVRSLGFGEAVGVLPDVPLTAAARLFELPRTAAIEESPERLERKLEAMLGSG